MILTPRGSKTHAGNSRLPESRRRRGPPGNEVAMPGYDGTGPRGKGPMTGKGAGYCVLKFPRAEHKPVEGFAGRLGLPVRLPALSGSVQGAQKPWIFLSGLSNPHQNTTPVAILSLRLKAVAARLAELEWRVARLCRAMDDRRSPVGRLAFRHPRSQRVRRPQRGGSS